MNDDEDISGPYLPPGTAVRYDGLEEGGPEYGIDVDCWIDKEMGAYDCYWGNQSRSRTSYGMRPHR